MPDYTGCTDLFAIAKAIARNYEAERKARELDRMIQLDEEGYGDEARQEAYNRQECARIAREEGRPR